MTTTNSTVKCMILCKQCGSTAEAEWRKGFLKMGRGWHVQNNICPECRKNIYISKSMSIVKCPHCGKLVQELSNGTCLNCGKEIYRPHETIHVECPDCGVVNVISKQHKGGTNCYACNDYLSERLIKRYLKLSEAVAQQISLPSAPEMKNKLSINGNPADVIWKLPETTFPYKSRLLVSEGTYGVLMQNGVCQYPLEPGSYLLEDTDLEQSERFDKALNDDTIIFRTDVYCVTKQLGTHPVGAGAKGSSFTSPDKKHTYSIAGNADVVLEIIDAKAFMEFVNYSECGIKELFYTASTSTTSPGLMTIALRDAFTVSLTKSASELCSSRGIEPKDLPDNLALFSDALIANMNSRLNRFGVSVSNITALDIRPVEKAESVNLTVNRDDVLRAAKSRFNWTAAPFSVIYTGQHDRKATFQFSGSCMLKVDEEYFFQNPAVEKIMEAQAYADIEKMKQETVSDLLNTVGDIMKHVQSEINTEAISDLVVELFEEAVNASLQNITQRMVNDGSIDDIRDINLHTQELSELLKADISARLCLYGLDIYSLVLAPVQITFSSELEDYLAIDKKKKQIIRFVEKSFDWRIPSSVIVHVKDKPDYAAAVDFNGTCRFRVTDPERYFSLSEAEAFIEEKNGDSVLEQNISDYYRKLANDQFGQYMQSGTQLFIDTYDPDIRYLSELSDRMGSYIRQQLDPLVASWGLRIETLTVYPQINIAPGGILAANLAYLDGKARHDIDLKKYQDNTDTSVAKDQIDANAETQRSGIRIKQLETESAEQDVIEAENEKRKERANRLKVYDYEIQRAWKAKNTVATKEDMVMDAEIKALKDKLSADQKTRSFDELLTAFRREKSMDENYIIKDMDKADLIQGRQLSRRHALIEGLNKIDDMSLNYVQRRERSIADHAYDIQKVQQASALDAEQFNKTLNGILHDIDSADLTWQQKLDEYNRLTNQFAFQDSLEQQRQLAEANNQSRMDSARTTEEIAGMQLDTQAKLFKIQEEQARQQANLAEWIARCAEDRKERQDSSTFDRNEKTAIRTFAQHLQDRKALIDQQIDLLRVQFEERENDRKHVEALKDKEVEIAKLQAQLKYYTERDYETNKTERTKAQTEAEAKASEAVAQLFSSAFNRDAEAERLVREQERNDNLLDKAMELYKAKAEIEKALAEKNIDAHISDIKEQSRAQGAIAYADIIHNNNVRLLNDQLKDVQQAVENAKEDKLSKAFDLVLGSQADILRNLTEKVPAQPGASVRSEPSLKQIINALEENNKKLIDEIKNLQVAVCPRCKQKMTGAYCSNCGYPGTERRFI